MFFNFSLDVRQTLRHTYPMNNDVCLFQLLEWPEATLKQALPKAPARLLARLVRAYPRTAGRPFMNLLEQCMSTHTLAFLKEEIASEMTPTYLEIRQAEAELLKLFREEAKRVKPSAATLADTARKIAA
jgi:hypothetical protein